MWMKQIKNYSIFIVLIVEQFWSQFVLVEYLKLGNLKDNILEPLFM